jgi:hypothetical protein
MRHWELKLVRREGVDVTDTALDVATDVDGLDIELTRRLTTVSGGVSDDRGAYAERARRRVRMRPCAHETSETVG